MYRSAFPDSNLKVRDQIAGGDKVVSRFASQDTHKEELIGIPATGKHVQLTGITIGRIANGKVVEGLTEFDQADMLTQLGVLPMPE
jgi:predicted ester cyclase